VQDLYGDWLRQREIEEDGVILVRPDKHIGWRAHNMVEDPQTALFEVLSSLLSRSSTEAGESVDDLLELVG
jgi:2,4-dichlorophenol 6-monooxygenase